MMDFEPTDLWDLLRFIVVGMFGMSLGLTAAILRAYAGVLKQTRRLLPQHIAGVTVALIGFELMAVWQTIERVGQGFTFYVPANLFLFGMTLFALDAVRRHITRKRDAHQEILPLIQDPKETD